ncbi:MAG: hypothetical protein ACYST6_02685 [Planctomycetota bacterium]|jgi:hypothetical protein
MKWCYKWIVTLLSIMVLTLFACSKKERGRVSDWSTEPPTADKIEETNKVRDKYGIRRIKGSWTFYGREFGVEKWKDGKFTCKTVCCDDKDRRPRVKNRATEESSRGYSYETILYETDYYYTGRTYLGHDSDAGPSSEVLTVTYDYSQKRFGLLVVTDNKQIEALVKSLKDMLTRPERYGPVVLGYMARTNAETLLVADRILEIWGLRRL